jgi:phosphoenolpyruvate carboxykinase (ATP)
MKDPTLPPVVKLKGASLASVMGATLATKRSSAERLAPGVDPNKLVVVPYANPFRTYPLANDYAKFKKLVEEKNVDCYIVNTGDFMGKKVQPKDTLGILEAIVEGKAEFKKWGPFSDIEIMGESRTAIRIAIYVHRLVSPDVASPSIDHDVEAYA